MVKKNQPVRPEPSALRAAAFRGEMMFSGPLPPPEVLTKYNEAVPNAAERILVMAEKQADHRRGLEAKVVASNAFNQTLGSVFAFILGLIAIGGGIYLIASGKSTEGLASIISSLTVLGGIFVYGRRQQRRERAEKASEFAGQ